MQTRPEETLLIIFQGDEPKHLTHGIRLQFPYVYIIFHKLSEPKTDKLMGGIPYSFDEIPEDLWKRTTILFTLGTLPATPELAPNLKWIQLTSAGVDHFVNHPMFKDTNIPITTVSGIHAPAIAEWVLMSALDLSKNYSVLSDNQRRRKWDSKSAGLIKRGVWRGKNVGILGYGSIGRQVARVFDAIGAQIYAYTATPRPTPESKRDHGFVLPGTGDPDGTIPAHWYSGETKNDLHNFLTFSNLDLLLVAVPLTPETRHFLGKEEFDLLHQTSLGKISWNASIEDPVGDGNTLPEGEGCIISNVSRGAVIDQDALVSALKEGKILGAALDVTEPEPLPEDSELWGMDNVIVTPHVSGLFNDYWHFSFMVLAENLKRRENGEEMVNLVQRKRGY